MSHPSFTSAVAPKTLIITAEGVDDFGATGRIEITYGIDADRDSLKSKQNVFDFLTVATTGAMDFKTRGITGLYPDIDVSTLAGFIQGSYEATDRLTVNGGVRYQYVTTEVSSFAGAAQQVAVLNESDPLSTASLAATSAMMLPCLMQA